MLEECFDINPSNLSDAIANSGVPIVLRGFGKEWPLVKAAKRSPVDAVSHISNAHSGEPLSACYLPASARGRVYYSDDFTGFNFETKRISFQRFIEDLMREDDVESTIYVGSTELGRLFPGLKNECVIDHSLANGLVNIWLGGRTNVAAHYDVQQNLACCLVGRRAFKLFPPEQVVNLYPGPLHFAPGGREISLVDATSPDYERFPRYKEAESNSYTVVLEPGDALILPSLWWHQVEGLDSFNVLLTHWWQNAPRYLGRPTNALLMALMSIRDLPKHERAAWYALFKYYIFESDRDGANHIPENARGPLESPLSEEEARKLRAQLQNSLRR